MPDTTPRSHSARPTRSNTASPLRERTARHGKRGSGDSPPDWPEEFEPAAVLKGYLDGLAGTPDHSRRDAAYWYGHLDALADRQPGQGPALDMAGQKRWH